LSNISKGTAFYDNSQHTANSTQTASFNNWQHTSCHYSNILSVRTHVLHFSVLQLILWFTTKYLMKALEVFLLGSQARMTSNKHDGHCMLKFYPLSESQQELTSNNCQVQQCPCKCVLISRMRTHSI